MNMYAAYWAMSHTKTIQRDFVRVNKRGTTITNNTGWNHLKPHCLRSAVRVTATAKKLPVRANQESNQESSNPESDTLSIVLLALHSQGLVLSNVLCHRPELYFAIVHFIERPIAGRQQASQPANQPFPGGLVVRIWCSHRHGPGFDSRSGKVILPSDGGP